MFKYFAPAIIIVATANTALALDAELYGQVNKGIFGYDDGANTDVVVVDNDLSSSRFGFKGKEDLKNGLTASMLFEVEMQSNPSNLFTQNNTAGQSSTPLSGGNSGAGSNVSVDERQANVGLSGSFGGIYIGQQSTATDGMLTQDLTGVTDVMSSEVRKIGGALQFRNSAGGLTGLTVNGETSSAGNKRDDSIRYESPVIEGFQGKASIAQGGDAEGAVFYNNTLGDFKLKGAVGVEFNNDSASTGTHTDARYGASISTLHNSGLGLTVAYTTDTVEPEPTGANDREGWYSKVGYAWNDIEVAADYGLSQHYGSLTAADDDLTSMGLGVQYTLIKGVTASALYRNFDIERTGVTAEALDLYGVNMRVKF